MPLVKAFLWLGFSKALAVNTTICERPFIYGLCLSICLQRNSGIMTELNDWKVCRHKKLSHGTLAYVHSPRHFSEYLLTLNIRWKKQQHMYKKDATAIFGLNQTSHRIHLEIAKGLERERRMWARRRGYVEAETPPLAMWSAPPGIPRQAAGRMAAAGVWWVWGEGVLVRVGWGRGRGG